MTLEIAPEPKKEVKLNDFQKNLEALGQTSSLLPRDELEKERIKAWFDMGQQSMVERLNKSILKIESQKVNIKNLEGFNVVLQSAIEKMVGTCNEVVTELNTATGILSEEGEK